MRNNDPGSAASPAGRRPPAAAFGPLGMSDFGRRIVAWALHGPPWSFVALAIAGLAAALLLAGLKG
jgi:hypothetical protein